MPAFPLSDSGQPRAGANRTTAPLSQVDKPPLPPEDLIAAHDLVERNCFAQALVLTGALERLHGPHDELRQLASTCRAKLAVNDVTCVTIDTGRLGPQGRSLRRSG